MLLIRALQTQGPALRYASLLGAPGRAAFSRDASSFADASSECAYHGLRSEDDRPTLSSQPAHSFHPPSSPSFSWPSPHACRPLLASCSRLLADRPTGHPAGVSAFAHHPHSALFITAASSPAAPQSPAVSTSSTPSSNAATGSASSAADSAANPPSQQAGASSGPASAASSGGPDAEPQPQQPLVWPPPNDFVYIGPLSYTHKLLKRISIANTAIAFAAAPAIVAFSEISYVSRVGLAGTMVFFGLLTTGALHWITNPYVHELRYTAATQTLDVRTSSLLGRARWSKFQLGDVQVMSWERPVATFMAKGRPYYIDIFSFDDPHLLACLTPEEGSVPKGYKDDEDD